MSTALPALPLLTGSDEEELLTSALALESSKGDGKERLRVFADRNTLRRARPVFWQMASRGLMSPKLLARMLTVLADDVAHADDAELWGVLRETPAGLGDLTPCLFDDYPIAVDTIFMEAVRRAPEVAVTSLPAHVAAALPLVRTRLGLSSAEPTPELLQKLLAVQLVQAGRVPAEPVTIAANGTLSSTTPPSTRPSRTSRRGAIRTSRCSGSSAASPASARAWRRRSSLASPGTATRPRRASSTPRASRRTRP
jgi:hypothetical protein